MPRSSGRKVRQWIWDQVTKGGYFYGVTMSLNGGFMINQHSLILIFLPSLGSWPRVIFFIQLQAKGVWREMQEMQQNDTPVKRRDKPRGTVRVHWGKCSSGNSDQAVCILLWKQLHVDFRAQQCWHPHANTDLFSKLGLHQGSLLSKT